MTASPRDVQGGVVINRVKEGFYLDSVALMRIALNLEGREEVDTAALMIGTPANKEILSGAGLLADAARSATAHDLIIAIRLHPAAAGADAMDDAMDGTMGTMAARLLETAEEALIHPRQAHRDGAQWRPRRLDTALRMLPGANLALISVPGSHACAEARRALAAGLHVMIFSDNVPLEDEARLKDEARELGLLVMGPDCGTALINGAPLAFANEVPRGGIGIVSASGTGLQEVSCLIARMGGGVSHGIGTGGRDLKGEVGGVTTLMAIEALEADPGTEHIVLLSKPPDPLVATLVMDRAAASPKGFTICYLGNEAAAPLPHIRMAGTLREAAELAIDALIPHSRVPEPPGGTAAATLPPRDGWVRGLFTGGTLCAEAQVVLGRAGLSLLSNAPVPGVAVAAPGGGVAPGHLLLDLGADEYTQGRPHPMIDPRPRCDLLRQTLRDPEVAVVLLDVVLGHGAHENPADPLARTLREAREQAPAGTPPVVVSVCGTEADPQGYTAQCEQLREAGALVASCNAAAAEAALGLVKGRS